jgi:hypothetical protein
MGLDGSSGEVKSVRYLLVAQAQCHEREHASLSLCQSFEILERRYGGSDQASSPWGKGHALEVYVFCRRPNNRETLRHGVRRCFNPR